MDDRRTAAATFSVRPAVHEPCQHACRALTVLQPSRLRLPVDFLALCPALSPLAWTLALGAASASTMASNEEEYRELLNAEVFIELDKLRDIAQHGVPDSLRGEVWCYLLGVHHPDKCASPSPLRERQDQALL